MTENNVFNVIGDIHAQTLAVSGFPVSFSRFYLIALVVIPTSAVSLTYPNFASDYMSDG
jgi:hypothetical protein